MKKTAYFVLLCLCFLIGCRSLELSSTSSTSLEPEKSPEVAIPSADDLESITLILIDHHASQFGMDFDHAKYQYVQLDITDATKIKELVQIFQEMNPRVVPWPKGLLSSPAPSRLILKRKESVLLKPNEIGEWDLAVGKNFFTVFVKLVTDMEFPGLERLGGGYLVKTSPEGSKKLMDVLKQELQENRHNEKACVFVPWPTRAD